MSYELSNQEDLIIKYLPLVKGIVSRIDSKSHDFDFDDLVSIGVIGLMDALKKYDHKKKVPFEAYASFRIRGAVLDELRKAGPVSRDRIDKLNQYYMAKEKLENNLMRTPSETEICEELDIDERQLLKLHETVHYLSGVSLESIVFSSEGKDTELIDVLEDKGSMSPEEHLMDRERKKMLIKAIDQLEDREKTLLNLYYVEELSMKEIGYILDISIPRVSQIHGRTLLKLKNLVRPYLEE